MNYYMIVVDNTFVGAVHSGAFVKEGAHQKLFYSDDIRGEFVNYEGTLYRDYWMPPVNTTRQFTIAEITKISEQEYNDIRAAIDNNEEIIIDDDEEEEVPVVIPDEDPSAVIQYMRESKIREMSAACRSIIEAGIDLELRGEIHHFSLDTQDQLNLISLSAMAQTQSLIPYHADGESCIFYTNQEINEIVETATAFKIYHTTYYNALKGYINALETIEDIAAIQYGTEIPEQYKSDVLKALEQ